MSFSVAIDGPAGAGKSTIAKEIAKRLGYIYVDTGAMYRAMALYMIRKNIKPDETDKMSLASKEVDITIEYYNGEQLVILNGENVNPFIRSEEVGNMASVSSANKDVRFKLVDLQRQLASKADVIMDGRDIGTYVLPNANIKIYLTASSKVRAKRRYEELTQKGLSCNIEEIEKDIIERDRRDSTREFAPLKQAEDAILIDSSDMSIEQVINTVIKMVNGGNK
ncbi:(d)CMP kinase [Candidatus Galacturonibacter soehngenii]|uniref:Cytidylate kinase n=1 Tax=Candidatus Galacturonatibacter soehngenii TaxID=2307010 RepID=A0A7V7UCJ8_9FIRM|nr:(d)CMP kinase [Candidatus Galacturonibacter soehngenii]KAB1439427.1 (d)CMP kinase [Candidatus Galacturonibacter soehngenii]MBA4687291.1 (d)CMP kinase [Candidatus Galacturonibacter soehngenii]